MTDQVSYTPEDVITRVIDAEFGDTSEWAMEAGALCPCCSRKIAVAIREALEAEGFRIVGGSQNDE